MLTRAWVDLHPVEPCCTPLFITGEELRICFPMGYGEMEAGSMVSGTGSKPSFYLLMFCESTLFVSSHLLDKKKVSFSLRGLECCTTRISGLRWKAACVGLRPGSNPNTAPQMKAIGDSLDSRSLGFLL